MLAWEVIMTEQRISKLDYRMRWTVFIAIALTQAALIYKLLVTTNNEIPILFAIAVIAGLLILSPRVYDLSSLLMSRNEFRAELRPINDRLDEAERRIGNLFLITMSQAMFENLKKLGRDQGFGSYEKSAGLERELYHLRDIGYIDVNSVKEIPARGNNLSDFVKITPAGKQFIDLREGMEKIGKVE
jgi:hypothetical protein